MSEPTPEELEQLRSKLAQSGKAERPDPARSAAGLEALLEGRVVPGDFEGPPAKKRRPVLRVALAVGVAIIVALWLWPPDESPAQHVEMDAGVAAVIAVPPTPVVEADAGVEVEAVDAGPAPVVDAGLARAAPPRVELDEADLLARELALLDEARRQLGTNPAGTIAVLDTYSRTFPRGGLRAEADVVRLEALLQLGRRKEAEALATRLMARDKEGLIRERVKRLLAR